MCDSNQNGDSADAAATPGAGPLPIVAIVGRPNVGKSTLFNRISGTRKAVVLDTPGVTRDRNYIECEIGGRPFTLIDTGGYDPDNANSIAAQMCEQVQMAIDEADVVLFVADLRAPDHPADFEMIEMLRRAKKPSFLAVNKCDNVQQETEAYAFGNLGAGDIYPISAVHGSGVAELLEAAMDSLPQAEVAAPAESDALRIAVIGRQNVGKSTLVNAIVGRERVIANATPGTTRDAIDTPFTHGGKDYVLVDTAGIRRRGKIAWGIERLSVTSALFSLKRCDVALIVLNAEEGLTDQDAHIAGFAEESGRLLVFVVNKWDAVEKDSATAGEFAIKIRDHFKFLSYVPIQFVSAKEVDRVDRMFGIIDRLLPQYRMQISTSKVNQAVEDALARHPPPPRSGGRLKVNYAVQTGTAPPIFSLFVNNPKLMHFSYRRYLVNRLRESFGLTEVPLWLKLRAKAPARTEE